MPTRAETSDLKDRAEKVNDLLKRTKASTGSARKALKALAETTSALDKELKNFTKALEALPDSEESVAAIRHLQTKNGLNLRLSNALNGQLGRVQDTSSDIVSVS